MSGVLKGLKAVFHISQTGLFLPDVPKISLAILDCINEGKERSLFPFRCVRYVRDHHFTWYV